MFVSLGIHGTGSKVIPTTCFDDWFSSLLVSGSIVLLKMIEGLIRLLSMCGVFLRTKKPVLRKHLKLKHTNLDSSVVRAVMSLHISLLLENPIVFP